MTLTTVRPLPAFLLIVALGARPPAAFAEPHPAPRHGAPRTTIDRLSLYSPRVRRSTIAYLRLRLLELREEDLERARAAIERRLTIDELLAGRPRAAAPPAVKEGP